MPGALDGLKVVDFGHYIAGPLLAMLLADAGAEVVHVDPPGGPRWDDDANAVLQRGKRSIELDLKSAADVESAFNLVRHADVLVENFRPGVMDRLGLGFGALQTANPGLVYCSIPGFSAEDPRSTTRCVGGDRVGGHVDLPPAATLRSGRPHHRHRPLLHGHASALYLRRGDRRACHGCGADRSRSLGAGSTSGSVSLRRGVRGLWARAADGAQHGLRGIQAPAAPRARALPVQGRTLAAPLPVRGSAHALVRTGVRA